MKERKRSSPPDRLIASAKMDGSEDSSFATADGRRLVPEFERFNNHTAAF